jgi:hypothetical protein
MLPVAAGTGTTDQDRGRALALFELLGISDLAAERCVPQWKLGQVSRATQQHTRSCRQCMPGDFLVSSWVTLWFRARLSLEYGSENAAGQVPAYSPVSRK